MNVNKNIINYLVSGARLSYVDKNGKTNLNKLYINGNDGFIASLDLLTAILSNNLSEESAKDICRKIGSIIGATSNY